MKKDYALSPLLGFKREEATKITFQRSNDVALETRR